MVREYLAHGEAGLAFDHLMYMIIEPPSTISRDAFARLGRLMEALGFSAASLESIIVEP